MKNNENTKSYLWISEEAETHRDTGEELKFLHAVSDGDMDFVHKNCEERRFLDDKGVGQLSSDPVLNLKYHLVVTAALITRMCIARGLESEHAFRMSDFYIRKLDDAHTEEAVEAIHNSMVLDFTGKMRLIKRDKGLSRTITKCVDYIYSHIYDRITIKDLSEYTGVSSSYLSRQFAKELGLPISDYIREKKIELSQEMLRNTDDSLPDIALRLSFSSQSHFIQTFKSVVGMTPKKYRSLNGYSSWT
ncbi:MAG: helix-turn-helix domain-containing protein [Eubacterium sp.]|nr:helix-turn-helix domain-containing protein [Eubacterium sp.]